MNYELERKERERQIKYGGGINGLGSLNNTNNNKVMNYSNVPTSNFNNLNNNINNNIINNINNNINNNTNNINDNRDLNIQEINNNTITRPSLNKEEKEKQRRKQMEYNEILRQQVEERNKIKEMAKKKEKEEEIKFEEKLRRQLIENQKRAELIRNNEFKNNKYAHNLESPENFMANPMNTMPIPQINIQEQNFQINNNINNPNYTGFTNYYGNNNANNNLMNNTNINKYRTIDAKTDLANNNINLNIPNNLNNFNNNPNNYFNITPSTNTNTNDAYKNIQNTPNTFPQRPTPSQTATAFNSTNRTLNNNINKNLPYLESNKKSNTRPISQQSQKRVRNDTWRMEELYMGFVQEQLKIINEYETNINKYQSMKKDNFDTIKDLMTIKNQALDKIQEAQNKFKETVGVYPMDNNFNNRVTNLMDMMLEKKINDIQRENKLEILANNFNKQKKNASNNGRQNYNIINPNYMNENGLQLNENNEENNEYIPISESQINRNIMGCGYKSKYEELKQSMINGNEASQELRTSMSLAGISKFVKQNKLVENNENINIQDNSNNNGIDNNNNYDNVFSNINNGQSNLYTTWNSEKFPEESQNNNVNNLKNENDSPINDNENKNNLNQNNINQEIIDTNVDKKVPTQTNQNNKKINQRRNNSKGILNDSQLPSKIVGNDKGLFNHPNDEMSGSNISMQESNSNINNYMNGSDLNIEHPFNSPSPNLKNQQTSANNTFQNNDTSELKNRKKMNLAKNVKNMKLTKEEKDRSLLLVGDNIIKNNLTHEGYSKREKENKEKSYVIGNIGTINTNMNDNTLNNYTNQNNSANNTFTHFNTNLNNNLTKSQDSENNITKENENISLGVTVPSKKNGYIGENNETDEDIVRGFGPSQMNSMLNDETTSNFNHSNINNNSGMSAVNIMTKNTYGKKKGIVNTNKEIQQIKEAEEKEEEENYAYDFTLDNKTLKKLEEEEKSQNSKKINLDDYKAIKESQKIQTQLNFFEDSVLENISISKSKAKGRIIKSYNMLGNKNQNIIKNLTNQLTNNENGNNSPSKRSNNTNNTNQKRPQSPKYNRNNNKKNDNDISDINNNNETSQNNGKNMNNYNDNSSLTNLGNDSFGDHIINDLNKYRKMFLEESSMD